MPDFFCTVDTVVFFVNTFYFPSHLDVMFFPAAVLFRMLLTVAKNYLNQDEVSELNRVVNMWLDFAEDQARRRQQVFLRDWQEKLDQFLQFNDREVLQGAGIVSKKAADEKAQAEYLQFAEQQRRLKEAEGEKDIAGLLRWETNTKK